MEQNAFILDWTMDNTPRLKQRLSDAHFLAVPEGEHLRVTVPHARAAEFARIVRGHLNAPCNYVDVQFPDERQTLIIFAEQVFTICDPAENERVKAWAIARGLPPEQANWPVQW